ncbi:uncharacterized protein N7459_001551 [Penicillium hispanicum]|uniref:uncharacterized protein n=1 Tax=Penicillium hispanicum TaxID=1080232 RepID=UPI0025414FF2|nr:uncharacterized protein N7459_001551 [Penicillium hispanicum]KAJ5595343.1 hypothetical protein N7459_001551 [Penicillium hispanicum]
MATAKEPPTKGTLFPEQTNRVIVPATADTIRTKRLILRPLALTDAEDIFEHRSRQDVADWLLLTCHTHPRLTAGTGALFPSSWPKIPHKDIQETRDSITAKIFKTPDASGAVGRQFSFAIILADDPSQKVIGALGVNALSPSPSIGYGTHPDTWGKGYASEAVAALVDAWWKLPRKDPEPSEKLFAGCNRANVGSFKVLLNNGFKIYKEFPMEGDEVALFELEKPQN